MMSNRPAGRVFREGEEVVLAKGTYQGALGVFVRLKEDVNWAEITERNGSIRSHPVAWLDHSTGSTGSSVEMRSAGQKGRPEDRVEARLNGALNERVEAWEGEGGAVPGRLAESPQSTSD